MSVNGFSIKITYKLRVAIRHLRLPGGHRVFWTDQVCIDQKNISERNHQMRLMNRVCSTAETVIVWLGEATPESDVAIDILKQHRGRPIPRDKLTMKELFDSLVTRVAWWT